MSCPYKNDKGAEILLEYVSGKLDPDASAEFEKHARECVECGELAALQNEVWQSLDEWTPAEISRDFDARLYARIAQEESASRWTRWWRAVLDPAARFAYWKPALAAAVACAVVAVGLTVRVPAAHDPGKQVRTEVVDIEQVEHTLEDLDMLTPSQAAGNRL